jgi:hypothetical protein
MEIAHVEIPTSIPLKRCRNTAGNYSRVWEPTNWPQRGTKPGPPGCSGFAQAPLRLKQQLLRSKDGMEIAHVEIPMSNSL